MYSAAIPLVLFLALVTIGLKDGDVSWGEAAVAGVVLAVAIAAWLIFSPHIAVVLVPACVIDFWLVFRLGLAPMSVPRLRR